MDPQDLLKLIVSRRSIRRFKRGMLTEHDILQLIEAARFAPSATNLQPWRFTVVKSGAKKKAMAQVVREQLKKILNRISEDRGQSQPFKDYSEYFTFFEDAPVVLAVSYKPYPVRALGLTEVDEEIEAEDFKKFTAIQSVSAAVQNILLVAHSMGLGGCWMTDPLIARKRLEEALSIKEPYRLMALVPIGIPLRETPAPRRKRSDLIMKVI